MRLWVGQRADALFRALPKPARQWWQPWTWVIPDPSLAPWLKARGVERDGVATGWRFESPPSFWEQHAARTTGERLVRPSTLEVWLLGALLERPPEAVRPYVEQALGTGDRELRVEQLAQRLVRWVCGTRWQVGRLPEGELAQWVDDLRREYGVRFLDEVVDIPGFESLEGPVVFWDAVGAAVPVLRAISRLQGEVAVVTSNPCVEFWEDLPRRNPAARRRFPSRQAPLLFPAPEENPLLVHWGAAGRPTLAALNTLGQGDQEAVFLAPDPETSLGRLQTDILLRQAPEPLRQDASLQWRAAPSPREEAEQALRALAAHPELPLNSVVISLTGAESDPALRAHLMAVLAEAEIPFSEVAAPVAGPEGGLGLFLRLLELAALGFPFGLATEVLRHPHLDVDLDSEEREVVVGWIKALPVVDGAAHLDHADTYIDRDVFNWEQGLRRLALGLWFEHGQPVELGGQSYVAHGAGASELTGRALGSLRGLLSDLSALRAARAPGRWATALQELAGRWVRVDSEQDSRHLSWLFDSMESLHGEQGSFSLPLIRRWLLRRLKTMRPSRGSPWTRGLTVGPLDATSRATARLRVVMGLRDDAFPGREGSVRFRPEGSASLEDEDRFHFLRGLMNTTDSLWLTHSELDRSPPSAVLLELGTYLEGPASAEGHGPTGPVVDAATPSVPPGPVATSLRLTDLVRFLQNPHEAWEEVVLGRPIPTSDPDPSESFQWPPFAADQAMMKSLAASWPDDSCTGPTLPPPGTEGAPAGPFHQAEQRRIQRIFADIQAKLVEAGLPRRPLTAVTSRSVDLQPRDRLRVELSVPGHLICTAEGGAHLVQVGTRRSSKERWTLTVFIHHVVRNLSGPSWTRGLWAGGDGQTQRVSFRALGSQEAHRLLHRWCESLVLESHDYSLPSAAARTLAELRVQDTPESELRKRHLRLANAYGDQVPPFPDFEACLDAVDRGWTQVLRAREETG